MTARLAVTAAVEGPTDEAVARRILDVLGLDLLYVYGLKGKNHLDQRLRHYNAAAEFAPWLVLRDLDRDAECAPELRHVLLPTPSPRMRFRLAVRSVESWLLGDRSTLSRYLQVPIGHIPDNPDALPDPKSTLVTLARRSRNRAIRRDLVPTHPSVRVGQGYSSRVIEYVFRFWRPLEAARHSDSLKRCIERLRALPRQG